MSKLKGPDRGYKSMSGPVMEGAAQLGNIAIDSASLFPNAGGDVLSRPFYRPDPSLDNLSPQDLRDRFLVNPVDRGVRGFTMQSPEVLRNRFLQKLGD